LKEIKSELKDFQKKNPLEDKLDELLIEVVKNREYLKKQGMNATQFAQQPLPPQIPNNIFYPPMFPNYMPFNYNQNQESQPSTQENKKGNKNKRMRNLRKYFLAVAFTVFLKSEAKKLSQARKANFRKFYLEKFDDQILLVKNWIVEGNSYAIPVILEKK